MTLILKAKDALLMQTMLECLEADIIGYNEDNEAHFHKHYELCIVRDILKDMYPVSLGQSLQLSISKPKLELMLFVVLDAKMRLQYLQKSELRYIHRQNINSLLSTLLKLGGIMN